MTIMEHDYAVAGDDELARLLGAATPHFALQIRDRVLAVIGSLPEDDPRVEALRAEVTRLEALAVHGAQGPNHDADLPARPSLEGVHRQDPTRP
ncbi:MAG: hypothetical protein EXQ74_07260 [Thermoleophilia bacterium]|nr:hypothetical protein [Thermoleophilia bacterium]